MYTTQKQVRAAFWEMVREFKPQGVTPRRITNYSGNGKMHNTDTRCCFCDWLDAEEKAGNLAPGLAERVTL
jgi:hypothetical protein